MPNSNINKYPKQEELLFHREQVDLIYPLLMPVFDVHTKRNKISERLLYFRAAKKQIGTET